MKKKKPKGIFQNFSWRIESVMSDYSTKRKKNLNTIWEKTIFFLTWRFTGFVSFCFTTFQLIFVIQRGKKIGTRFKY